MKAENLHDLVGQIEMRLSGELYAALHTVEDKPVDPEEAKKLVIEVLKKYFVPEVKVSFNSHFGGGRITINYDWDF